MHVRTCLSLLTVLTTLLLASQLSAAILPNEYFDVSVTATGVELPSGSYQAVRMRGIGVQRYQCANTGSVSSPTYSWVLSQPKAKLWFYNGNSFNTANAPDGAHGFLNVGLNGVAGSAPYWQIGSNCNDNTAVPLPPQCTSPTGVFVGRSPQSAAQSNSIPWLLLSKDENNMFPQSVAGQPMYNRLWNFNYMQRVDTSGGLAPDASLCNQNTVGNFNDSLYQCDYVLGFTGIGITTDPITATPANCFQFLPLFASGTQNYVCNSAGSWVLSYPSALLYSYSTQTSMTNSSFISGRHYFQNVGQNGNAGSSPVWEVGGQCDANVCANLTGRWTGAGGAASSPQPNTIAWLLLSLNTSSPLYYNNNNNNYFSQFPYSQRLSTVNGTAPAGSCNAGDTFASSYSANYVFLLCRGAAGSLFTSHAISVSSLLVIVVLALVSAF